MKISAPMSQVASAALCKVCFQFGAYVHGDSFVVVFAGNDNAFGLAVILQTACQTGKYHPAN